MKNNDVDVKLIKYLTMNGRISITRLAEETGLSYTAVRNRLKRLFGNGLLEIKPIVSAKIYGTTAAFLRIKTRNPVKLVEKFSSCNKLVGIMSTGSEVLVLLASRTKKDIAYTIDRIISSDPGLEEFSIEYGRIPSFIKIPIKNPEPDCENCIYYKLKLCSGCLPLLRVKNRKG